MPLRIFNNLSSQYAQNRLSSHNDNIGKAIVTVASGERLNNSSDDGASLAISESLLSNALAFRQGARNLQDGLPLINNIAEILIRTRELASQSSTGTIGDTERQTIQLEFEAQKQEINRITNTNEFLSQKLLDWSLSSNATGDDVIIHIGLDSRTENRINLNETLNLRATTTTGLGIEDLDISTADGAKEDLVRLQEAVGDLSGARARVDATQNRLTRAIQNLAANIENLTAAASTIRDADVAEEVTRLTKQLLLVQTSSAMVGQSNLIPKGVQLLLQ
ncbi:MAG: flagellin FliC [Nitrospina sp.]|nr:flagellin FliC [Nitrospina sp.]